MNPTQRIKLATALIHDFGIASARYPHLNNGLFVVDQDDLQRELSRLLSDKVVPTSLSLGGVYRDTAGITRPSGNYANSILTIKWFASTSSWVTISATAKIGDHVERVHLTPAHKLPTEVA